MLLIAGAVIVTAALYADYRIYCSTACGISNHYGYSINDMISDLGVSAALLILMLQCV
ncbi:MAG: hypothetical protein ACP5RP_01295 [Candidatus Micrarchaeia archaeon]